MQIDMHYYGVYSLARVAGLRPDAALVLATACQFVDDATSGDVGVHPAGARFRAVKTAHHPWQLGPNNDPDDQVDVWVPFHFIPGNQGETFAQRLICRRDSEVARAMIDHHLEQLHEPWGLVLLGIGLHTYLDTFAHYGFSGLSSRLNRVRTDNLEIYGAAPAVRDYLGERVAGFFEKYGDQGGVLSGFRSLVSRGGQDLSAADTDGALGHGAVAVYPDQPYLKWSFAYEFPELVGDTFSDRDNHADYFAAAHAAYELFGRVLQVRPDLAANRRQDFDEVAGVVHEILGHESGSRGRSARWQRRVAQGALYEGEDRPIPPYDATVWRSELVGLGALEAPRKARYRFSYRFNQAAMLHRTWVLHEQLPRLGIALL